MMSFLLSDALVVSTFLCLIQVSVFAAVAGIATRFLISRRPSLATTVSYTAIAVIVLLTVAIPIAVPRWMVIESGTSSPPTAAAHSRSNVDSEVVSDQGDSLSENAATGPLIDVGGLIDQRRSRVRIESQAPHRWSASTACLMIIGLGVVIGTIRFAAGVTATVLLAWQSDRPADRRAERTLGKLLSDSSLPGTITLLQSDQLSSAAVIGVMRPKILLPGEWTVWTDAELRSVLAHELAHVVGKDFSWRVLSSAAGALHFCNPLVHYLVRSMVLAQEVTADAAAATMIDRNVYIRSLSSLALRRDQSNAGRTRAGLAPVFSGYLIRRIKMLDNNKNLGLEHTTRRLRIIVATTLAVSGLAVFTMRGYAAPPASESKQAPLAADAPAARVARATNPRPVADPLAGLFRRDSVSSSDVIQNETGMVEIRLADLLGHKDFQQFVSLANWGLAAELQSYFELKELPVIDLRSVDLIYGSAQVAVRPAEQPGKSRLMLGSGSPPFNVRFTEPVDVVSWTKNHVPGTVEKRANGRIILEIPPIPMLGPTSILLANRDPKTVSIGSLYQRDLHADDLESEKRSGEFVDSIQFTSRSNNSSWSNAFDQVNGGLFTLAFTNQEIRTPVEFDPCDRVGLELIAAQALHRLQHSFENAGLGIDLNPEGTKFGVRVRLEAADDARADLMLADIRQLARLGAELLSEPLSEENPETDDPKQRQLAISLCTQMLERLEIEKMHDRDGTPCVQVRASAGHPELASLITAFIMGDD